MSEEVNPKPRVGVLTFEGAASLRLTSLVVLLGVVVVFGASGLPATPKSAFACTGPFDPYTLDEFATESDAVALVLVSSVMGATNRAPTVTPTGTLTPAPTSTPNAMSAESAGPESPESPGSRFDLSGFGASLHVTRALAGSMPVDLQVDEAGRRDLEQRLRVLESKGGLSSCPLSTPHHFFAAEQYVVFLKHLPEGWKTLMRFRLEGSDVTLFEDPSDDENLPLYMSQRLYDSMPGLPAAEAVFASFDAPPLPPTVRITASRIPLNSLDDAQFVARGGTLAEPSTVASPGVPGKIRPPDTGSGGLWLSRVGPPQ